MKHLLLFSLFYKRGLGKLSNLSEITLLVTDGNMIWTHPSDSKVGECVSRAIWPLWQKAPHVKAQHSMAGSRRVFLTSWCLPWNGDPHEPFSVSISVFNPNTSWTIQLPFNLNLEIGEDRKECRREWWRAREIGNRSHWGGGRSGQVGRRWL